MKAESATAEGGSILLPGPPLQPLLDEETTKQKTRTRRWGHCYHL